MFGLIKFAIGFVICFVILSFEVNNKTLFSHISEIAGPIGKEVQDSLKKSVKRSYNKTKDIGEEFFHNADPKYFDEIKSKRSSMSSKKSKDHILEEIHYEDAKKLDNIIDSNK